MEGLRGHTTGYAVPQYVIDGPPAAAARLPIIGLCSEPKRRSRGHSHISEGKIFEYPEDREGVVAAALETGARTELGLALANMGRASADIPRQPEMASRLCAIRCDAPGPRGSHSFSPSY